MDQQKVAFPVRRGEACQHGMVSGGQLQPSS
jgi:hypothetical protein